MHSERSSSYFRDIVDNIERIERYVVGMDASGLYADPMRLDAVERCFQRITEAASRLRDTAEALAPSIPWKNIRAFGNHLRHAYDRLQPATMWRTIADDLPPLKAACRAALETLENRDGA